MSIQGVEKWLQTPQGRYVMDWEQARLDEALADVFGFFALQLGMPERDFLRANRIPTRLILGDTPGTDLCCDFAQLPIASQSVDLVVLPHVLEFYPDPHQILREVERILIPEGRLFILGFNPFSLWGLRRKLPPRPRGYPWDGHYLSILRLKDWLNLLNFELDRGAFGAYAPPCKTARWLRRWRFMELAGDRWWGFAGSVYMIRAIKRIHGMRLIVPNWRHPRLRAKTKALTPIARKEEPDV
ncbi:class I SAM-dependent methyltransferase [Azovibrio restrictus]|uniref:class I SAM-dependent methyltransferase n=1 Tax=Azovibrio restrictus TaxID=146938 RepID=UPI0026EEEB9C|nr:class I SAM-dependent methyltransferase [Azovibrio restrictus]